MGYIQGLERKQIIFLPDTLDDYVGEENEVRAIDAFIDTINIAQMGFKAEPAREGRPEYDPRYMPKLYIWLSEPYTLIPPPAERSVGSDGT